MKKLDSLQVGRAVAVLSVLAFHFAGLSVGYQNGSFYAPWTHVLRAGVDVFFVISGVVMAVTTYSKFGLPGPAKRFLVHRVSRIYPPHLFLTALLFVFWIYNPGSVNRQSGGVNLLASFTLWPSIRGLPLVQVGWTLSFEMMFYLAFFLMLVFIKRDRLPRALLIWSLGVLAGMAAIAADSSGTLLQHFPRASFVFCPYVFEFVAGCYIGLAYLKTRFAWGRASLLAGFLLYAAESVVFQVINLHEGKLGGNRTGLRVMLFGIPAALLVYGLLATGDETNRWRAPRWLIRCGDMSYSIYLVQLPVMHFAFRYAYRFFDHPGQRWFFLPVTVVVCLAASVAFYYLIERTLSGWTKNSLERVFRVKNRVAVVSVPAERSRVPVAAKAD